MKTPTRSAPITQLLTRRRGLLPVAAALLLCAGPMTAYCADLDLAPPELQAGTDSALVLQVGHHNSAQITQHGIDKAARIAQVGAQNNASITQTGLADQAIAVQYGAGNSATIYQTGSNDQAITAQYGAGNQAYVLQTASDAGARVNEIGLGNKIIVLQTHPSSTPVNVNTIGIGTTRLVIE